MLGFLRRWWSRDHQREIFTYSDGRTQRRADPIVVGRALEEARPDYLETLNTLYSEIPAELLAKAGPVVNENLRKQKEAAIATLVKAADAAFGLTPLDDSGGLTEAERLRVLVDYLVFMQRLADAARPFSTSQPRASPSPPPDSPTEPSAASGTAANG